MNRRLLVVVPIVLIGGAVAVWYFVLRPPDGPADRLQLSGTVEATTTQVGTEVGARVVRLAVNEGDRVDEGELVAELSREIGQARLSQAEAAHAKARQAHTQSSVSAEVQEAVLDAQVEQAQRAVATAEASLADLLAGARPESIRETEAGVRQAQAQVRAAQQELAKAEAGPREQEIAQAEAAVAQADEQVRAARARLDELRAGTREQDIEQARAALETARVRAAKTRTDAERMQQLHDQGVVSADQLEQAQTAFQSAQEAVRSAEAALSKALEGPREETIRAAEAGLQQALAARRQAREQLDLLREGTRPEDVEAARAAVEQAHEQVEAARQRLKALQAGPTEEQIRVARRQVDEARAALRLARERRREARVAREQAEVAGREAQRAEAAAEEAAISLDKHVVAAPSEGLVDTVNVEPGEVVSPGSSLVTLIDPEDLWVTVFVPEPQMPRVQVGQRAQVTVDGWEQPFEAELYWIAEDAEFTPKYVLTEDERTRLVYEVRVRPLRTEGRLKPGMPADVSITVR